MYKQKDCSDFQNHYIYKNISLKLGITPKHWFTNIKVLWKDPKHVCMCVCINILLPHYIKVTNLKTVLTYKQIKVKQSPLNGLNITWHAAWAVYQWLFRNNHQWTTRGSWKRTGAATPTPAAEGITANTPSTLHRTKTWRRSSPHASQWPACLHHQLWDLCRHRAAVSSLKPTALAG